ncbi:MAG: [protein-PII] uridylyltransferase [Actinobacteria bacterium]|nr:[protein-PII] uridylyltransferase [Actinomycetota bacterium]
MGTRERRERSDHSDRTFSNLFQSALDALPADLNRNSIKIALAAVGGYGRGELSPGSDLDIVLLHDGKLSDDQLLAFTNAILYPMWDGVGAESKTPRKIDHSVRTRSQTREAAHEDLRVAMGLLDIRLICGDPDVVAAVQSDAIEQWRSNSSTYLTKLRASLTERHQRSGELAYLLEPDLKEARGGLRDITALRAIALSGAISVQLERISKAESLLNNVRESLHIESGRDRDRLLFQEQDKVAKDLHFRDADVLMSEVAQSARDVDYVLEYTWHRLDHRGKDGLSRFLRKPRTTSVAKGISVASQEVVLDSDAPIAQDPALGLRAAATAAQLGLPLSMDSCVALAKSIEDGFGKLPNPWPREAREDLVALIGAGSAMVRVWEALDQEGIITSWLPEWAPLRSLPQRNVLHRHTVDRHMVETAVHAAALTRRVRRPDLLLVAALFHDLGKGGKEDHSVRGAHLIEPLVRRIGFSESDVLTLKTLVEHHLLLSSTATRRDLNDPVTIASILNVIPDIQTLELLHALSIADGEATGSAAWSEWKSKLVSELVARTRSAMTGTTVAQELELSDEERNFAQLGKLQVNVVARDSGYFIDIIAPDQPGLLSIVAGVLNLSRLDVRSARTKSYGSSAVMKWIVDLDPNAPIPTAEKLHTDIEQALRGGVDLAKRISERARAYAQLPTIPVPPPEVEVFLDASADSTVFEVRSHDRPALLFRIGEAITRCGVDIHSAIVTTLGAEAIDTLYVREIGAGQLTSQRADQVAKELASALR